MTGALGVCDAYRDAVAALERLRVALLEAGLLDAAGAVPSLAAETPEERRRRLARERTRRWRDAQTVTQAVTVTHPSVTERHEQRHGDSNHSVTVTSRSVTDPRAHARTSSEELISPPVCSLRSQTSHPTNLDGVTESQVATTPDAAPVATPEAGSRSRRRKPMPRQRPAQPLQSTIDPSPDSPAIPASVRASAGQDGGPPPTDADRVWSAYVAAVAPTRVRLTPPRAALIARRLREYPADELVRSISGYARSAFHRGENDRGRPYQALELWLRDAAHVEAGWGYLDQTATPRTKKGVALFDGIEAEWESVAQKRAAEAAALADDVFA